MLSYLVDNRAGYSEAHVIQALVLLAGMPHGRFLIMKKLNLNEASARTLLSRLERNGYSKTSTYGHVLTKKGLSFVKKLNGRIMGPINIGKTPLTLSKNNVAYVVRGAAAHVNSGLEQRDMAIKLGASGMTTLVYKNKLMVPSVKRKVPEAMNKLFTLKKDDVVLIGSADTEEKASLVALYAAYKLVF